MLATFSVTIPTSHSPAQPRGTCSVTPSQAHRDAECSGQSFNGHHGQVAGARALLVNIHLFLSCWKSEAGAWKPALGGWEGGKGTVLPAQSRAVSQATWCGSLSEELGPHLEKPAGLTVPMRAGRSQAATPAAPAQSYAGGQQVAGAALQPAHTALQHWDGASPGSEGSKLTLPRRFLPY